MKKRLLILALALVFCAGLMPGVTLSGWAMDNDGPGDAPRDSYDLWIGDVQVTTDNMDNIPGVIGGTASYDPDNCILTMNGVTGISGSHENAKIHVGSFNMTIKGDCSMDAAGLRYGIHTTGNLTIAGDVEVKNAEFIGIYIDGNHKLVISSGKINVSSEKTLYGMVGGNSSSMIVNGGDVTVESSGSDQYGNGNGIDFGSFSMTDGKLSAKGYSVGLFAYQFTQTGGSIYAEGQIAPGILVGNGYSPSLTVKGEVEAVTSSPERSAIQSYKSSISINSGYYIEKPVGGRTEWDGNGQIIVNSDGTKANHVIIAKKPTFYDLYLAGTRVSSINAADLSVIDGVEGTASYDAETNTLNLNGATITGLASDSIGSNDADGAIVYAGTEDFTINVTGGETVATGGNTKRNTSCGLFLGDPEDVWSGVFRYNVTVNISEGATLTLNGGVPDTSYAYATSIGLYGMTTGNMTLTGAGTLNANGGASIYSYGILATADLTVASGTVNAAGADSTHFSTGLSAGGSVIINGGKVTAAGGAVSNESGAESFGIYGSPYSGHKVTINGGDVTVTGYKSALNMPATLGEGVTAGGSVNMDGSGAVVYNADDNDSYKWFRSPFEAETGGIIRLSGKSRYLTAIAAADHLKEKKGIETFNSIVVASGDGFPDALSASYLAYRKDAPILLYGKTAAEAMTDYINDNLAPDGKVYIVGGKGAVPLEVEDMIDGTVQRLSGKDRYGTNLEVLREAGLEFDDSENVLVACGTNFADALSASAVGEPILLVGNTLTPSQTEFLAAFLPGEGEAGYQSYEFSIIGGKGAVPDAVEDQLRELGTVERISGSNRFLTSIAVAEHFFTGSVNTVVIANGMNFPDGLSGGPVATAYGAPLVLVTDGVNDHAVKYFEDKNSIRLIIMGGKGVVSDETAEKIFGETE